MGREGLIYVTQVAPYRDGPAGVHGVLGQSAIAMGELAGAADLAFQEVPDVARLEARELVKARVVALFTIGETPWDSAQRAALLDGVRSGRTHLVAIHAATDSCYGWDEYGSLVGARFNGHPWTQDLTLVVCDPAHPSLAHLDSKWPWHDEVYQFRDLRTDARVLLRVDESQLDLTRPGVVRQPFGFPLAWCFQEGQGRIFSTSLGHFPAAWESVDYLPTWPAVCPGCSVNEGCARAGSAVHTTAMAITHAVRAEPLSAVAFAPFGQVIAAGDAVMELRDGEVFHLNVLHYDRKPLRCNHLNRHHKATQALVALAGKPTLLVVAPAALDFSTDDHLAHIRAFACDGTAGVNLALGTWHWGPYPITDHVDLVNVQGKGFADDNEVAYLERDLGAVVEVVL